MAEVISGFGFELIGANIVSGFYLTSGVSLQVNHRREVEDPDVTIVLLSQTGGLAFPHKEKEQQGMQVLVDARTHSLAQSKAREIYEFWEETVAKVISGGHQVLWVRAIAPPQAIPNGPGDRRFQFSVNFDAMIVKN